MRIILATLSTVMRRLFDIYIYIIIYIEYMHVNVRATVAHKHPAKVYQLLDYDYHYLEFNPSGGELTARNTHHM